MCYSAIVTRWLLSPRDVERYFILDRWDLLKDKFHSCPNEHEENGNLLYTVIILPLPGSSGVQELSPTWAFGPNIKDSWIPDQVD